MKLERGLKHQDDAVNSIVRVFENVNIEKTSSLTDNPIIDLESPSILKNIEKIQDNNNIPREMKSNVGVEDNYLNIDIKMETGTGKTFTQIKTIYELNDKYGFNKFIIVVPTLPIKAGTKQFIQSKDTKVFFEDEYKGVEIELRLVESIQKKKGRDYFPSVIREFVTSSNLNTKKIQVMLINSQLITNGKMLTKNYDTTILDDLTNPSDAIKSTNPILIVDEPQKIGKLETYAKEGAEYLSTLGFSKKFCHTCEGLNRYIPAEPREKESDILEVIDQFSGLILRRPEREAFTPKEALIILKERNLKHVENRYLEDFCLFVEAMENVYIRDNVDVPVIRKLAFLCEREKNVKSFIAKLSSRYSDEIDQLMGISIKEQAQDTLYKNEQVKNVKEKANRLQTTVHRYTRKIPHIY